MVLNTLYLDAAMLRKAREIYLKETPHNISLETFFQPVIFTLLQQKILSSAFARHFHPYKFNYYTAKNEALQHFLNGSYFQKLIGEILQIQKYTFSYEIRKFEPGCFTLLHDDLPHEPPGIDFVINFSEAAPTHGGYIQYVDAAQELVKVVPSPNSLTIVGRPKGVMCYTKYVAHQQKFPLLYVAGTIIINSTPAD